MLDKVFASHPQNASQLFFIIYHVAFSKMNKLIKITSNAVRSNFVNTFRRTFVTRRNSTEKRIDMRSDTVTKPSAEMLKAMYQASVGDDVYKEDETMNYLENMAAQMFGMEKALFVPSGTMGNLICIMAHCDGRGQELIIGSDQHIYVYEQGHFMQLASVAARVIPNQPDGTLALSDIERNIRTGEDFHDCETRLICLENTHMSCGGVPLSNEYLHHVGNLSWKHNIPLHIDGARLFNAAVATNQSLGDLLVHASSVSMCLSKGLGCPIGSVIGGSEKFIKKASRARKGLGGGMRQVGFLAAAGIFALEHAHIYLQKDHDCAKLLAQCINNHQMHELLYVDCQNVRTNIVFAISQQQRAQEIVEKLKEQNILATAFTDSLIRLVTHRDVSEKNIMTFDSSLKDILLQFS